MEVEKMKGLPLQGVRVTDFTQIGAGGWSTQWLAVLGADVIKIESRRHQDFLRIMARDPARSPDFGAIGYGKKDVALNLTQPRAVELAKEIIKVSDVVAENFATGQMERFGLGYETLKELRPDLIMVSVCGLGRSGPDRNYRAYAPTVHAVSGMCSLTGYYGGPPNLMGGFWIDCLAAQTAAYAVIAALHHRSRTGEGQYIDLAMNEVMLSLLPEAVMDYTMNQRVRGRMGNRDDILAPHGCYRCQGEDKWVAIAVTNEEEWHALCHALGRKEWLEDERFADQLQRWNNQEELDALITEWTKGRTAHEVMEILQKAGVPAGPSANVDQMVDDPQLRERDFFVEIDHPLMGKGLYASLPIRLSACARGNYSPAPMLGEHNSYVFHELLGMPEEEIARLVEEEVIY